MPAHFETLQLRRVFAGASVPQPVELGDLWYDTVAALWRYATVISPPTFAAIDGGGSGAPADATYLALSANATLTNERVFTPGTALSAVDGGAGGAYTLNATVDAPTNATYLTLSLNGTLSDERVLTAGTGIVFADTGANGTLTVRIGNLIISRGGTILNPTAALNVITWRAPYACTVTNVRGYRVGGTGATINARRNGTDNHLASALSLTSADTWTDGGSVQNTAYAAGDKMEIMSVTVTGAVSQLGIQIDLTRT